MNDPATGCRSTRQIREVYAIEGETMGLVKIGSADNARKRLAALQVGSPDKLRLRGVVRTSDATGLESTFHYRFGHLRSHGEWFHPAPELLDAVDALLWPTGMKPLTVMREDLAAEEIRNAAVYVERREGETEEAFAERAVAEFEAARPRVLAFPRPT